MPYESLNLLEKFLPLYFFLQIFQPRFSAFFEGQPTSIYTSIESSHSTLEETEVVSWPSNQKKILSRVLAWLLSRGVIQITSHLQRSGKFMSHVLYANHPLDF